MTVHSAKLLVSVNPCVKLPVCLTDPMPSSKTRPMRGQGLKKLLYVSGFATLSLALGGASCDKKSVANPTDPGPAVPFEAPKATAAPAAEGTKVAAAPSPEPAPAAAATAKGSDHLNELLEKLPSPCGKAMSLRRTLDA